MKRTLQLSANRFPRTHTYTDTHTHTRKKHLWTPAPSERELRAHLLTHLIQNGRFSADVRRSHTDKIPPPASVLGLSWLRAPYSYEVKGNVAKTESETR